MLSITDWYQKNKEKRAEYDKQCPLKFEYQESHKRSSQKHRQSKKMLGFHLLHLLQSYVRILYQIFVLTLLQMCLKKLVVLFVENDSNLYNGRAF